MQESTALLVDSHIHLQDPVFQSGLAEHMQRARAEGVGNFVCNGSSEEDWTAVGRLAMENPRVIPCFGLHPWYVGSRSAAWYDILEHNLRSRPSAVGEIGLDCWIEPRDELAQEEVFLAQWRLARQLDLPVMVHCLRAWGWLMNLLKREPIPSRGFMLHAYGGSAELVHPLLDQGAYFSFAGTVLSENRYKAREALKRIPRNRLFLETDAPDLMPPPGFCPYRLNDAEGKLRNHPANLGAIARGVSEILCLSFPQLCDQLRDNCRRFLGALLIE